MTSPRLLALLIVAALLGCASAPASGPGRPSPQIITQQEIVDFGPGSAYDVIHRLRPNFLVSRGATTFGNAQKTSPYPNIYLDGIPYGDITTLKNLDAAQIGEIRMYSASDAQLKFGLGNSAGVIGITTRK